MSIKLAENLLMGLMFILAIFAFYALGQTGSLLQKTGSHTKNKSISKLMTYFYLATLMYPTNKLDSQGKQYRKDFYKWAVYFLITIILMFILLLIGIEILKILDVSG